MAIKISQEYLLSNRTTTGKTGDIPFGNIGLRAGQTSVPRGLFCVYEPSKQGLIPSLHGMRMHKTMEPMRVCLICNGGYMHSTYEIKDTPQPRVTVLHTGPDVLCQGDRFAVTLPTENDAAKQLKCLANTPANHLAGGLLSIKKIDHNLSQALVKKVTSLNGNIVADLTCPGTLSKIFAALSLIQGVSLGARIGVNTITAARDIVTGTNAGNQATVQELVNLLTDENVLAYLNFILTHAQELLEKVRGYALGQVLFAETGV